MSLGLLGGRPLGGAVSLGLRVQRCAVGIADRGVVWVAPCDWDWRAGRPQGGAVSFGLLGRASSTWRRVIGIADQRVVWVARDC